MSGESVKRVLPFTMYRREVYRFVVGNIWLASYGLSGQSSDEIYQEYKNVKQTKKSNLQFTYIHYQLDAITYLLTLW